MEKRTMCCSHPLSRIGTPEPPPLLRRYAAQLTAADARELGRVVLESWLAYDTALPTEAEVAPRIKQLMQYGMPPEQARQAAMAQPKGSAIAHKGLLGVAAATAQDAAAAPVARYLKEWYRSNGAVCSHSHAAILIAEGESSLQQEMFPVARFIVGQADEKRVRVSQLLHGYRSRHE